MSSLADFMRGNMPTTTFNDNSVDATDDEPTDDRPSKPIPWDSVFRQIPSDEPTVVQAARYNDVQMIERLARQGENLNVICECDYVIKSNHLYRSMRLVRYSALHVACVHSDKNVIETLVNHNADVNIKDGNNRTPLHCAAACGRRDVIDFLLAQGAEINAQSSSGKTALMEAIQGWSVQVVRSLIEKGADVNLRDTKGTSALLMAVFVNLQGRRRRDLEICKVLLDAGAAVDGENNMQGTPLMTATGIKNFDAMKLLLRYGADINRVDNRNRTAFHFCAEQRHMDQIGWLLIHHGADVNTPDSKGKTLLDKALDNSKIPMVRFLLSADCIRDNDLDNSEKMQKLCELFPPFRTTLRKEFHEVWSLKRLCRYKIRNSLFRGNLTVIRNLNIPRILQDYLLLY